MSKSAKQRIILCILVIALGGLAAAYYGLGARQEREAAAALEETPAVQLLRLIERTEAEIVRATFASELHNFTIEASEDDSGRNIWLYAGNPDIMLDQSAARSMMRDVFALSATDMVLENVENPAEYGIGRVVATSYFSDGSREVLRLGSMTPDHQRFYVMRDGDPALYLITSLAGNRLSQGVGDLIERSLPIVNEMMLRQIVVKERGRNPVEFAWDGTEEELEDVVNQFGGTWLTMVTPFPGRELHMSSFEHHVMEDFAHFSLGEVAEAFPEDLAQFGLDDPLLEFIMEDVPRNRFHLIFGDNHDDDHIYVMLADRPHVFLANRRPMEGLLNLNPFRLIDRFVALVNITTVDKVIIESRGDRQDFEIVINNFVDENERDQIAPVINGSEVLDDQFRRVYQSMVGMVFDQEIELWEDPGVPDIIITYYMLDDTEPPVIVEFFAYDANFYAIRRPGDPLQFVTSRRAVDIMFETIEDLLEETTGLHSIVLPR